MEGTAPALEAAGEKHLREPAGPSRRRVLKGFGALGGAAIGGLALVAGCAFAMWRLSWPHTEPIGNPEFGINFSCRQAEYLLLEDPAAGPAGYVDRNRPDRPAWCAETLGKLLDLTGTKRVRLAVEWATVEPRPGEYDFRLIDAMLAEAARHDATVLLGVGVKALRHPEFYIPDWVAAKAELEDDAIISNDPYLRDRALEMIAAVVRHVSASPVIDSWAADNEPYVASARAEAWTLGREFVAREAATIRANDPAGRPVVINHGQHFVFDRRWEDALADADILGASVYPFRNYDIAGRQYVLPILEIGPLGPNYAAQSRAAGKQGKQFWITEMQAEPWFDGDMRTLSPDNPSKNLTHHNLDRVVAYARRSGASRIYLWGAEWWLYESERFGDSSWLVQARRAVDLEIPGGAPGLVRK